MLSKWRPRSKYINYNVRSKINLNESRSKKNVGDKESYEGAEHTSKVNTMHINYLIKLIKTGQRVMDINDWQQITGNKTFRFDCILQRLGQGYVLEWDLGHQKNKDYEIVCTLLGVPLRNTVEYELEK
jgi:hypothetical protein